MKLSQLNQNEATTAMYRVEFKENGKYFMFDFENQSTALSFFNLSRKMKERSEIKYIVL